MPVIKDKNKLSLDKDFIIEQYDPVPWTIFPDGIEPDENGMIYAHKGSFIDKDGKVITISGTDSLTFSAEPIGILTERLDLTYGQKVGSILKHGLIQPEYLNYPEGMEYNDGFIASITQKLPLIMCYGGQQYTDSYSAQPTKVAATPKGDK